MIPRIVWLASYPKSGNTWLRVFLSNLTGDATTPADMNSLRHSATSYRRSMFDQVLGFDTGDLSAEACAQLRPVVYRWMNAELREVVYCKTHDAWERLGNGDWVMAPDVTDRAIYILRNPLDVVVSLAHFSQITLDAAIQRLGDPDATLARQVPTNQHSQLEQRLGTWSHHVRSWTRNEQINTCTIRYEDLNRAPEATFATITAFLQLPHTAAERARAIDNASFDVLRDQEADAGFRERPQGVDRFFRQGKTGDWATVLSGRQIDKVVKDHLPVMQRFGYADADGTPRLA